jgi:hypothetical protein
LQIGEEEEAKRREKDATMRCLNMQQRASTSDAAGGEDEGARFVAYVPLPEQKEIEMRVVAKKKQELLAKYASDGLIRQQEEAKQLLNVPDT